MALSASWYELSQEVRGYMSYDSGKTRSHSQLAGLLGKRRPAKKGNGKKE
jgi:hypothetical protein